MRVVWQRQRIPKAWRRAGGVLKPKEKGASDISQFRPICLLDVKGKIFFSIVAQRQDSLAAWSIQAWSGTKSKQPRRTRETYMWFSLTWPMLLAQFPIIFSGNLSTSSMYQNISQHWSRPISKTYNCALQQPTTWQRLEVGIMAGYTVFWFSQWPWKSLSGPQNGWSAGNEPGPGSIFHLSEHTWMTWQLWPLLKHTPSSYLESCRRTLSGPKWKSSKSWSISIVKGVL